MKYYAVYLNGARHCVCTDKKQAENIKAALVERENKKQNKDNLFCNISATIREFEA